MVSKVYVKTDTKGRIVALDGGCTTPSDLTDWILIDEGTGEKYELCQSHYLDKPRADNRGVYQYKLVNGKPVERTQKEMDDDYNRMSAPEPEPVPVYATDEIGNKYRQEIGTDGKIHLVLVESYTGELFE